MLGVCREEDEVFFPCCPDQRRDQVPAVGGVALPLALGAVRIDPDMHGSRFSSSQGAPGTESPKSWGLTWRRRSSFSSLTFGAVSSFVSGVGRRIVATSAWP